MFTYGSVCSGIEAASVAWAPLGFEPLWFAEIERFPSAVLAHHWPNVPNLGDMTKLVGRILNGESQAPDILVGGTPCQAFSVAGLRGSLDDARGNLTLVLIRILDAIDFIRKRNRQPPCVLVWENVPGVLSTKDNAFGCFLGGLAGEDEPLEAAGEKWTNAGFVSGHARKIGWRILDAQYFGVPQLRRRVFLIASAGNVDIAKILFERESMRGDTPPRKTAGQEVAHAITTSVGNHGDASRDTYIVVNGRQDPVTSHIAGAVDTFAGTNVVARCLTTSCGTKLDFETDTFVINGCVINKTEKSGGNGVGVINDGTVYTLTSTDRHAIASRRTVRRFTPLECERLQGFPDFHTKIPYRGKSADDCPDTPRYKAIGNSMAVPVMRWIGTRIADGV